MRSVKSPLSIQLSRDNFINCEANEKSRFYCGTSCCNWSAAALVCLVAYVTAQDGSCTILFSQKTIIGSILNWYYLSAECHNIANVTTWVCGWDDDVDDSLQDCPSVGRFCSSSSRNSQSVSQPAGHMNKYWYTSSATNRCGIIIKLTDHCSRHRRHKQNPSFTSYDPWRRWYRTPWRRLFRGLESLIWQDFGGRKPCGLFKFEESFLVHPPTRSFVVPLSFSYPIIVHTHHLSLELLINSWPPLFIPPYIPIR